MHMKNTNLRYKANGKRGCFVLPFSKCEKYLKEDATTNYSQNNSLTNSILYK